MYATWHPTMYDRVRLSHCSSDTTCSCPLWWLNLEERIVTSTPPIDSVLPIGAVTCARKDGAGDMSGILKVPLVRLYLDNRSHRGSPKRRAIEVVRSYRRIRKWHHAVRKSGTERRG